ncbi:MMPL family transporter [Actinospica robiniae]|uniref:MMPL family transporter n=1 Tax=Actinospica robiniae TaxID=304901 RepID=UPI00040FD21B|nr:MMPL family transporter [Actinospica robiniae]
MRRIALFCSVHARWVILAWALVAVAGIAVTAGVSSRLSASFTLPGEPGYEANQAILSAVGSGGAQDPALIVVGVPPGQEVTSSAVAAALARGDAALTKALTVPGRHAPRVISYASAGDRALVSRDLRTTFVLAYPPNDGGVDVKPLGQSAGAIYARAADLGPGTTVGVTGIGELTGSSGGGTGVLAETAIGALGAILILGFVFGSFLAILPLITALASILTTFLLVGTLTTVVDVSVFVQFIVALIGLGVAIDYSLLVVTRWREERGRGRTNQDSVQAALHTAGRSVLYSGLTVALGLLALVVLPVPFLRSIGYGGVLIPLVSVLVSSTLLPALLATAGPFLDRPRRRNARTGPSRGWSAWARLVIRHRRIAAVAGLAVLAALLVPAFSLVAGEPSSTSLASSGTTRQNAERLADASIPSGVLTPIQILTDPGHADAVLGTTRALPGVYGVLQTGTLADQAHGVAVIDVLPERETNAAGGTMLIDQVRSATAGMNTQVGGSGAQFQAFNHAVYGSFPLMLALIAVISLILLTRTFRSLVLAVKALALNALSVGATYGVLVLVWQKGHGSSALWNIAATGAITNFVPLMVFAFLFGLSMDYEVFILARIREAYDADPQSGTDTAIVEGLGRTGRLVTSAALILALSFFALSQAPDTDLKVLATGLGAGILLDATIVRALLVPALLSMFGPYNWWLPTRFARLLHIPPSSPRPPARHEIPAQPEQTAPTVSGTS